MCTIATEGPCTLYDVDEGRPQLAVGRGGAGGGRAAQPADHRRAGGQRLQYRVQETRVTDVLQTGQRSCQANTQAVRD